MTGLESGVSAISGAVGFGFGDRCAIKDGGVWCWRADSYVSYTAPAAMPGLASGVSAISGTCALKEGGVWCWGDNSHGQLGNNSPAGESSVPVHVLFPPANSGDIAAAPSTEVAVQSPPPSSGEITAPDAKSLPSHTSTDAADHRAAYVLGGAAAALAIAVSGGWAVRRWRRMP